MDFRSGLESSNSYQQYGLQMMCLHHFQVNDVLSMPIKFHAYLLVHKYGKGYPIYFQILDQPLVRIKAHPCRVSIGIRIDQRNISQDLPIRKLSLQFEHYVSQTEGKFALEQPIIFVHMRYKTSLYVLYE